MKASELITLLQDAIDKYGDLEVGYRDHEFDLWFDIEEPREDKETLYGEKQKVLTLN